MQFKILTTNRTDSLQYNGANSSLQSISAQRGLELGTSRSLCQMLSNAPRAPPHVSLFTARVHIRNTYQCQFSQYVLISTKRIHFRNVIVIVIINLYSATSRNTPQRRPEMCINVSNRCSC